MFKRILCAALCLALLCGLTACGDSSPTPTKPQVDSPAVTPPAETVSSDKLEADDLAYVMIYNPRVFEARNNYDSSSLSTGDFGTQVNPDANRADSLETEENYALPTTLIGLPEDLQSIELNRADVLAETYDVGDKRILNYSTDSDINGPRGEAEFTCEYAGEYCYIWTYDAGVDAAKIEEYGEAFDEDVFEQMSDTFGEPRYDDKINILLYPFGVYYGGSIALGYFATMDLLAASEISPQEMERYLPNVNGNFLHINANAAVDDYFEPEVIPTLAHEYQHLLIASAAFENGLQALMNPWLNEAMSGYTEDMLFPGSKVDHNFAFLNTSDGIRHGQSLYNFATSGDDIGVYDSVYIFSEYLANLADEDVFSNIHEFWRTGSASTKEADALVDCVGEDVYNKIDELITYPSSISFANENEEWMSKLTLDFYIAQLAYNDDDPEAFGFIDSTALLYDEINGTDIEGGGRILLAVNDNAFEIPEDAGAGMIYVGFNSDFEVVTEYIAH